jgi:hypothetical protein
VDNTDRVKTFLTAHPGRFFCNRCLNEAIFLLGLHQVSHVTKPLRVVIPYRHGKMICTRCRGDRECTAYGQEPALPESVDPVQHP